MMLEKVV